MAENTASIVERFSPALRPQVAEWLEDEDHDEYIASLDPAAEVVAETPADLPKEIFRKCCIYKSCGNTWLALEEDYSYIPVGDDLYRREKRYSYRRDNGDYYFGDSTFEEILEELNDVRKFPIVE